MGEQMWTGMYGVWNSTILDGFVFFPLLNITCFACSMLFLSGVCRCFSKNIREIKDDKKGRQTLKHKQKES